MKTQKKLKKKFLLKNTLNLSGALKLTKKIQMKVKTKNWRNAKSKIGPYAINNHNIYTQTKNQQKDKCYFHNISMLIKNYKPTQ